MRVDPAQRERTAPLAHAMPGSAGWPGRPAPARPADSGGVFRIIWLAIGAVGTVGEVKRQFGRRQLAGLVVPPGALGSTPTGRRAAAAERQAREAGQEAAEASVRAGRLGSSSSGRYHRGRRAAARPANADHWLPAQGLVGWPGRAADSAGLPASLGYGSPSAGSELHRSSGCRKGRPHGVPDLSPSQATHQYGGRQQPSCRAGRPQGEGHLCCQRHRGRVVRASTVRIGVTTRR